MAKLLHQYKQDAEKQEWGTPDPLFKQYWIRHHFTLDAAASHENTKLHPCVCDRAIQEGYCINCGFIGRYFTQEDDALSKSWANERVWLNPPYGRGVGKWVKKCYEESLEGTLVVALLPSSTGTSWFQDYILGKADIEFLRGRIRFVGAPNVAPFDSMVVTYGKC